MLENVIQYPRKHDLVSLLELFGNKEILDRHLENAANLSDYATAFRYERRIPSIEGWNLPLPVLKPSFRI